jgi:hypothetical protein
MKKLIAAALTVGLTCVAVKPFLPDLRRYLRIRSM